MPLVLPADWNCPVDVPCPRCRYNLRMLREPRCPECGHASTWPALLAITCPRCGESLATCEAEACPQCRLELNWPELLSAGDGRGRLSVEFSDRPVWAALRAWWLALRPARFWRKIRLESTPNVRGLTRLRWGAVLVCIGGALLLILARLDVEAGSWGGWGMLLTGQVETSSHLVFYQGWRRTFIPWTIRQAANIAVVAMLVFAPGLVCAAALPCFARTLAKCRVRRDQLLRVGCFGAAGWAWIGTVAGAIGLVVLLHNYSTSRGRGWRPLVVDCEIIQEWPFSQGRFPTLISQPDTLAGALRAILVLTILLISLLWWWRFLYVGLRRFLRLPRRDAWLLLLSTQAIALLTIAIAGLWLMSLRVILTT